MTATCINHVLSMHYRNFSYLEMMFFIASLHTETCTDQINSTSFCLAPSSIKLSVLDCLDDSMQNYKRNKHSVMIKPLLFFILPFSPSSHKYDIGHIKLSLRFLHYIKTFIHNIHNKRNLQYININNGTQ